MNPQAEAFATAQVEGRRKVLLNFRPGTAWRTGSIRGAESQTHRACVRHGCVFRKLQGNALGEGSVGKVAQIVGISQNDIRRSLPWSSGHSRLAWQAQRLSAVIIRDAPRESRWLPGFHFVPRIPR